VRHCPAGAKTIAATGLSDVAAREAYLAAYHAAEAYIFERINKAAKTHRGVRSQFSRLARREPSIRREFLTFLARGYEFKTIADYGIGPAIDAISPDDANFAIDTAARFINAIAGLFATKPASRSDTKAIRATASETIPGRVAQSPGSSRQHLARQGPRGQLRNQC